MPLPLSQRTYFYLCVLDNNNTQVLQSASGMYRNLNSLAMQITRRGGLLMTCSCSGAMTQSGMFLRTLQASDFLYPVLSLAVETILTMPRIDIVCTSL